MRKEYYSPKVSSLEQKTNERKKQKNSMRLGLPGISTLCLSSIAGVVGGAVGSYVLSNAIGEKIDAPTFVRVIGGTFLLPYGTALGGYLGSRIGNVAAVGAELLAYGYRELREKVK